MRKNIKMNKEQMGMSKYRAIIPYGDQEIEIKNIDKEMREKITKMLIESVEKGEELDSKELINMLATELTNIEFEVNITEIEEPSYTISLILYYIGEIITELSEEIVLITQMATKRIEIPNEEKKVKEVKVEKIQEKIEKKEVKKPKRSRGKIARK